jgi:Tfp pilus assembly protein PilE
MVPSLPAAAWQTGGMSWIELLLAAVVVAVVAALTGIKPRGTRPVARSRLMKAARIVLLLIAAGLAALAIAGAVGGG